MKLELWRPLLELEKDWDPVFHLPRFMTERDDFSFRPSMDVARKDEELIVSAELPGIDPDKDVEIVLDSDYLTIRGEKAEEKTISEDDRYMHERRYGKFVRRIPVPEGVDADSITADYDKGILTVKVALPKESAPVEPRKIPVSSKKT